MISSITPTRGLYAITPQLESESRLYADVQQAVAGGARVVQYRDKTTDHARRRREATNLLAICHRAGAALIVNDDVELAYRVGADGVHVGDEDTSVEQARACLGRGAIVGASCYASLALAQRAVADGAAYVAFGSFFPSPSKPDAATAPVQVLAQARRTGLGVPVVAIGGITLDNAAMLLAAGADIVAVISAVFGAADIRRAAAGFAALFDPTPAS